MPSPRTITYRAAVLEALFGERRLDDSVIMMGEDIGAAGGVFKQTDGLSRSSARARHRYADLGRRIGIASAPP